jgi:VanZ family protein
MERLLFDPRARHVCAALWGVAWAVVAVLLLMPLSVPSGGDLVIHFLLFATMAFTAVGFNRHPAQLALLALVTAALGMALEYAQGYVPTRSSTVADAVANDLGAFVGYVAALTVLYVVIRPAEPRHRAAAR